MNNNLVIVSPKEAFNRGNLFDNYFWPYKYVANVKVNNEKNNLLYKIQMYCFASHELNLYLDMHPNDIEAIGLFNQYDEEAKKFKTIYEEQFGPLEIGINQGFTWEWISSPWPWERN